MNLKAWFFIGWMIIVLAVVPCLATRIPSVTASTDMGSGLGTNLQNSVNGAGLSALSLTATHAGTLPSNSWVSASTLTGTVTFDLGAIFTVDGFSLWNQNGGGPGASGSTGIRGVAVSTSTDGISFTPLSGGPTSFAQVTVNGGAPPEMFNFPSVSARFFRFTILSNHGDPAQTGFAEVGFNAAGPTPTPTPTPTPGPMTNGSFETGNYTGWITSDMVSPFSPLTVRGSGFTTGFGFFSTAPTDGNFASVDGFDGMGPGNIRIAQDLVIPAGTVTLTFHYRAAWDMMNFPGSTQARTLNVIVQPSGGGPNLLSRNILTAAPGTLNIDTGNRIATVNLSAFAGQSVRVIIDQFIPESLTGPGLMQIDNVRVAPTSTPPTRSLFDFDGDGKDDVSVYRNGIWYLLRSQLGFSAVNWGLSTDKTIAGDYDGDGKADTAVFRDGAWIILNSSNGAVSIVNWGLAGDIPMVGDYDGDNKTDFTVFRNGVWYILQSSNGGFVAASFGLSTDKPVVGKFDADNKSDIAVFRDGTWYILGSTAGFSAVSFGTTGDVPVPGDYDGDGRTDQAVYRSGVWYILGSTAGFSAVNFGISTDTPVPADYDGDGKSDVAVFRNGNWYILQSSNGAFSAVAFGTTGDRPIPAQLQ